MSQGNLVSQVDGLITRESGPWIKRKHYYLKEYIKIFTTGMGNKWAGRLTFIDLFAGPGRCLIERTKAEEEGSPILALQYPFGKYIFVEESPALMEALKQRCANSPKKDSVVFIENDSNKSIHEVVGQMPSGNLNLAFIDPTDVDIHYETIKVLSQCPNGVDLLMNIQYGMDIKRNFKIYRGQGEVSKLARFMGTDFDLSRLKKPSDVVEFYKIRIGELGYKTVEFRDIAVKNTKNAQMYFLLFASKHPTGLKFWREISKKDEQGQLEFPYN